MITFLAGVATGFVGTVLVAWVWSAHDDKKAREAERNRKLAALYSHPPQQQDYRTRGTRHS